MIGSPLVVVIDRDHAYLEMMHEVLADEGFHPLRWVGFHGAHDFVKQSQPDLIIVDSWLESPEDGEQLLAHIQADPLTQTIPVIVVTSDSRFRSRGQGRTAVAVLEKPFDLTDLLTHLRSLLRHDRRFAVD